MQFSHIVTLYKMAKAHDGAFTDMRPGETREVWGDLRSVKRAEFYAAQAAGVQTDAAVLLHRQDYDDEEQLEVGGLVYQVIRAYATGPDLIELTCARM